MKLQESKIQNLHSHIGNTGGKKLLAYSVVQDHKYELAFSSMVFIPFVPKVWPLVPKLVGTRREW
jgi:hypothetical protein